MERDGDGNGWWKWREFVIAALERHERANERLESRLNALILGGLFALMTAAITMGLYIAGNR